MSNNETDIEKNSHNKSMVWIICTILFVLVIISGAAFAKTRGKATGSSSSGKTAASGTDASVTNAISKEDDEDDDEEAEDENEDEAESDSKASVGDQKQITVKWQKEEYTGVYIGGLKNDKPSGEGTFVSDNEKIRYSGGWEKGKFHGSGTVTYADGTYETGSYEKGKRHGKIKEYKNENEYSVARYNEDQLYGVRIYYENGKEVKAKWYYKGKSVSNIEKKAIKLTPEVIKDRAYIDKTVYIEGTVCFSGETSKSEYFRIETDSVGMVIGKWSDNLGKYLKQANMPMLKVGDKVKIYGAYEDITKCWIYDDKEAYGYEYPEIKPIYGVITEEAADNTKASETNDAAEEKSYTYQELLDSPFAQYTRWVSGRYIIKGVVRSGKKIYIQAFPEDQKDREESLREIYTLFFNSEGNEILKAGEVIKVSGYMDGQYKVLKEEEKQRYNKQEDRTGSVADGNSGIWIDLNQTIFTYDYDRYPAIHVYKWKKKKK